MECHPRAAVKSFLFSLGLNFRLNNSGPSLLNLLPGPKFTAIRDLRQAEPRLFSLVFVTPLFNEKEEKEKAFYSSLIRKLDGIAKEREREFLLYSPAIETPSLFVCNWHEVSVCKTCLSGLAHWIMSQRYHKAAKIELYCRKIRIETMIAARKRRNRLALGWSSSFMLLFSFSVAQKRASLCSWRRQRW